MRLAEGNGHEAEPETKAELKATQDAQKRVAQRRSRKATAQA